ncbi:hypothetical protein [Bacillus sp. FJAT-45350]|uniref:hypothetical protein n=1 Tax=Bacillus sp. FJAT-45350 TaxID=2011014 RepID=UPI000BB94E77|nr:hypothetical protein [Bacillus sp. FJAT-45350]
MKIGIVSMYPYRPHVQDLVYLSDQLEKEGHTCYFLSCAASLPTCYYNLFKGKEKSLTQCLKCQLGGIKTYKNENVTSLDKNIKTKLDKEDISYILKSTIGSLGRIENDSESESVLSNDTKEKLVESVEIVLGNAENWIKEEKLDGVLLFNGRLDVTRSVMVALKKKNIPFISVENHLNGITLNYNEDCLSLKFINAINNKFKEIPLNKEQAEFAGKIIGEMFLKKQKIWRTHNLESIEASWPVRNTNDKTRKKVLITPSSKFEFLGNQEWEVEWTKDYTEGYEKVIRSLGVDFEDCVLRCHPFWNESLGSIGKGDKSENHYKTWAKSKGIHVIDSKDNTNTLDLIKEADIILVNGGTAGIEAALLGKTVVSIGKSRYYKAGFTTNVFKEADLKECLSRINNLNKNHIQKRAVRYIYNYHGRFEQFHDLVNKETTLENAYFSSDVVAEKIIKIFKDGKIEPYDIRVTEEVKYEDELVNSINENNWDELISLGIKNDEVDDKRYDINKRGIYRMVDIIRDKLPAGHY